MHALFLHPTPFYTFIQSHTFRLLTSKNTQVLLFGERKLEKQRTHKNDLISVLLVNTKILFKHVYVKSNRKK